MKLITTLSLLAVAWAYKDIDDFHNYYHDLHNKSRLYEYIGCFLDRNPCTPVAEHIKEHLLQLTLDGCAECDTIQKHYMHAFIDAVKQNYPDEFPNYQKKYDPDGKHNMSMLEKSIADS